MQKIIPRRSFYLTSQKLGEGAAGVVYKGIYNGEEVAVKLIKYTDIEISFLEDFCKEVEAMASVNHPNIVKFIGACVESPNIGIISEYMPLGSLRSILDNKTYIPPETIILLARDVAKAMKYLHLMGIIHRDLKSANLLVAADWHVKVTDFGMAKLMRESSLGNMTGNVGTLAWVAPEVLDPTVQTYTEKVDVYSYGIVIWEILTSDMPYINVELGLRNMIIAGGRPEIPEEATREWRSLINKCWHQDPSQRPSFSEILRYLRTIGDPLIGSDH
eukprot:TRINITY_DN1593_c0_g1_i2.p1 TRINITY_DN1593_c0_g1~~TRINITY_DN1593_c0_g1_i2.p1  ORF type:complete len:274 (-),score=38.28 TRINITY_DN1593_c0_g1_i2:95-916(-)